MGPSSDKALTFMKDHFLMDEHVVGAPLLVKSGVEYTQLAVETAQGLDGSSHVVLYLGTCEYGFQNILGMTRAGAQTQAEAGSLRGHPHVQVMI